MFTPNNPTQHETEYILDDKRKVIVNARDFTSFQFSLYKRGMFKRQRPDLSNYDFVIWKEKYRLGEYYLNEMRRKLNSEITRFHFQGHTARTKDANRHFEDQLIQLSQPFIKGCNFHIERTWEEASKIAAYMTKVGNRVQKYYLDYPYAKSHITAEKARELEDELATRLAREMRKAPVAKSQGGDDE